MCVFEISILISKLFFQIPPKKPQGGLAIKTGRIAIRFGIFIHSRILLALFPWFHQHKNIQIVFENKIHYMAIEASSTIASYISANYLYGDLQLILLFHSLDHE